MTTTIQDVMEEAYCQEEYEKELKQIGVDEYLSNSIDIGKCSLILSYLPIRRDNLENDYINHLYQSIQSLSGSTAVARSFVVMPLHLLFMLSLQYKVLRIYKEHKERYDLALTIKNPRDGEKGVLAPGSPLAISFLGEGEIIDLLKITGLSAENSKNLKKAVIRYRNDKIAHAKGYIEQDIENKIDEYLNWLSIVQSAFLKDNIAIANEWINDLEVGDDMDQFLESRFLDSCFCPRDFGDIIEDLLKNDQLDFDQWTQIVNKGLEFAYELTTSALHRLAKDKTDDRRFNAIRVLDENGEASEVEKIELESDIGHK